MIYLLDTHILLWALYNPEKVSVKTAEIIENSEIVFASVISLWEIAIKQSIGKLEIESSIADIALLCKQKDIGILPIKVEHLELLKTLPQIHNDPFDRLLIAQAKRENFTIISRDNKIARYDINVIS